MNDASATIGASDQFAHKDTATPPFRQGAGLLWSRARAHLGIVVTGVLLGLFATSEPTKSSLPGTTSTGVCLRAAHPHMLI